MTNLNSKSVVDSVVEYIESLPEGSSTTTFKILCKLYGEETAWNAFPKALSEAEETKIRIEDLCADDAEVDEKDHSLVNQTTLTLLELSDKEMMRVLRDIDNRDCSLAMKGLLGKARKRIFDNLSTNLAVMVVDDMEFMGPVRMHDVEEACIRILRTILKLEDSAELESHDFSVLKVVLDSRDIAERENKALKERYKELQ